MNALKKEMAARPIFAAQPIARDVSATELFERTKRRYPKTMARLAE